jgi:type I restriction enzyme S subunit
MLKRVKIGDLIKQKKAHSQTGPFGTQLKASDYVEFGTPVINVRNIGFGDIRSDSLEYVDEDMAKELKSHKLQKNDIVFGRKGAVERHSLISSKEEGWIQGSDCIRLRFLTDEFDPVFISYFFLTEYHKQWMINLGSFGATMGSLNQEIISKIEIPDIPLSIQRTIASILSTYGELIANNKQCIKLLEEMAAEIYKEWFVRLRFPGYETAKFFNEEGTEVKMGTVGALPERWEKLKAEKIYNIQIGKTPPREQTHWFTDNNRGVKWVSIRDINSSSVFVLGTSEEIIKDGIFKFNMNIAVKETVILSFKLTVGKVAIVFEDMVTNEAIAHFNLIDSCKMNREYTYCYLKYFQYGELGNTSSIGNAINSKIVKRMPIVAPPKQIIHSFGKSIYPILEEIKILAQKNQLLEQTRNLLLPRLISGKLNVEHLVDETELLMAAEPNADYQTKK